MFTVFNVVDGSAIQKVKEKLSTMATSTLSSAWKWTKLLLAVICLGNTVLGDFLGAVAEGNTAGAQTESSSKSTWQSIWDWTKGIITTLCTVNTFLSYYLGER
ncbi:unnamed protein product [Heterobilharzia americana]|nr:unnamed protein product [Heterobilharzia americana]